VSRSRTDGVTTRCALQATRQETSEYALAIPNSARILERPCTFSFVVNPNWERLFVAEYEVFVSKLSQRDAYIP
jgi:hypothetical protein